MLFVETCMVSYVNNIEYIHLPHIHHTHRSFGHPRVVFSIAILLLQLGSFLLLISLMKSISSQVRISSYIAKPCVDTYITQNSPVRKYVRTHPTSLCTQQAQSFDEKLERKLSLLLLF